MKVWDLHCDTLYELRRAEKAGAPKSFLHNDLHIDLEKLQQGDYLLQCFAAYVDLADPAPGADPLVSVLEEIDIFKRLMEAYPEKIAPVYTAADLERNRAEGKLSNPGFLAKAPAQLVEQERAKLEVTRDKAAKLAARIEDLRSM